MYTVITMLAFGGVEFGKLLVVQVQMSSLSCCIEGRSQQVYRWDGTAIYCQHTYVMLPSNSCKSVMSSI